MSGTVYIPAKPSSLSPPATKLAQINIPVLSSVGNRPSRPSSSTSVNSSIKIHRNKKQQHKRSVIYTTITSIPIFVNPMNPVVRILTNKSHNVVL